ncbi:haloacid dehalogenase-like hydrolase domain-containing protein 3 [Polyodon spathula]|uniref:haloacid dehalogenase-like hydrolase domain-containing protein 3 n=1 Tax=Polyodon spathula TaxID=7913 RepID=UPI001B7EFD85|nr:haloacid dehalogenase-like hydrolase domain-containing protein 3 [Polyodon spathula]XP_041094397.1 haloacid dehalogenase-like hydrolase domain-containing protein 3 [Polyodon spathula]XP_041094398.1 haloacid dehalogenase-like hydrolase domain-containing protein 3 [Polyodon spathula]XP_041094399.1 haloacid dehalogenase-like hydrolase domain-containing protein 3 [Polyodon spathula]
MRLRWLTWDVTDTLLRVRSSVGEQYCREARSLGLQLEPESVERAFRLAYKSQHQRFPNYGLSQGLSSREWWQHVVQETFSLCGVQGERALEPLAERLYRGFSGAHNWEAFPDVERALEQCRRLGLRMGVVSNFDQRLEQVLDSCGLRKHFDFVVTSESAGVAKPDGRIFREALRLSGLTEPSRAAHIGDDYWNDYRAAREQGMQSYLLQRKGAERGVDWGVPPEHRLSSLDKLPALLS